MGTVGKPDRNPGALRWGFQQKLEVLGGGVQQKLEDMNRGFTQAMKCFSQIQTIQTSRSLGFSASFKVVFKDVAQGRPHGQRKQVWN